MDFTSRYKLKEWRKTGKLNFQTVKRWHGQETDQGQSEETAQKMTYKNLKFTNLWGILKIRDGWRRTSSATVSPNGLGNLRRVTTVTALERIKTEMTKPWSDMCPLVQIKSGWRHLSCPAAVMDMWVLLEEMKERQPHMMLTTSHSNVPIEHIKGNVGTSTISHKCQYGMI